jgi:DNA mismatch repair protein MutL
LELLADLQAGLTPRDVDAQSKRMLAFLSCRSAIKAGDRLSKQECRSLLSELEHLDLAYTCPHGRPISVELPLPQVDRVFKRR